MKVKNICCIGAGYVGGPTKEAIAQSALPSKLLSLTKIRED